MITERVIVTDKSGQEIKPGDTVTDHRNETAVYRGITRYGRTGTAKVLVDDGWGSGPHEYNATVYGLTVVDR